MKYYVDFVGTYSYTATVEAETKEEAEAKGLNLLYEADVTDFDFFDNRCVDVFEAE